MSKDKSSISIWDNFSEKLESLREALNTPVDENDSSDKPSEESDVLHHFTSNDNVSLDSIDIESLRKALNTPIDEIISSDESTKEPTPEAQNDSKDFKELDSSDNENAAVAQAAQSSIPEIPAQTIEETTTVDETDLEEITDLEKLVKTLGEYGNPEDKQESQIIEETINTRVETNLADLTPTNDQIQKTDEPDKHDDTQESQAVEETIDTSAETDLADLTPANDQAQKTDEPDKHDDTQENQVVEEAIDTKVEADLIDLTPTDDQIQKTDKHDDTQEIHDVEIKIKTEKSIKNEKIDNYWKQGEKPNPYILKVDESREELNKSLKMARELVNQQTEEPPKQEKKRFQLRFPHGEKSGNNKSTKGKEKHSKNTTEFKPMVYEMLEPKQDTQPDQDNSANQPKNDKQDQRAKETPKKSDDRAKSEQDKEIINHRNRLEKSRSLGVPVFVKKPVNLEQIRQLKSMLIRQNNVKILVDTGSSQGRLLVISGQDPDTLLNTLGQLSIVKSTAVEDETINISL